MFITHKMLWNNHCQNRWLSSKGRPFDPTLLQFGESQSVSEHQIHHISHFRAHEPRVEIIPPRNSQLRCLRLRKSKPKRKNKTKQNKTSNSFSSAATTGFLNLKPSQKPYHFFPTPVDYQGGRKKKQQNHDQDCTRKKKLKLYPTKFPTTCFSTLPEMI